MRFLVIGELIEPGPSVPPEQLAGIIEQLAVPSLRMLGEWEAQGAGRGGAFVIDAESSEALGRLMASLPFWRIMKWDVRPLESWQAAAERDSGAVAALRSGGSR